MRQYQHRQVLQGFRLSPSEALNFGANHHFWMSKDRVFRDEKVFWACNCVSTTTKKCLAGCNYVSVRAPKLFSL